MFDGFEEPDQFPPWCSMGLNRLFDGKHRLEASVGWITEASVEWHVVPEGMTPKRYCCHFVGAAWGYDEQRRFEGVSS